MSTFMINNNAGEPAISYIRKSNLNGNQTIGNNLSIEGQTFYNSEYSKALKLNLMNTVTEVHTAYKSCPPLLKSLITKDYAGHHLLIHSIDRFSRNTLIGFKLLEDAQKLGIILHFVAENLRTDNDRHIHLIKTAILKNEDESRTIGARIKLANEIRRARGHHIGGVGYGYQIKNIKGIRTKVPKFQGKEYLVLSFILAASEETYELGHLNEILKSIVGARGFIPLSIEDENGEAQFTGEYSQVSNKNIAEILNSYNIKNRFGREWNTTQLRRVIKTNTKPEDAIVANLAAVGL